MAPRRRRRAAAALFATLALLAAALPACAGVTYPASIAATGDSITMAFNTGSFPYVDNPSGSWATGTSTTVNSIAARAAAARGGTVTRYLDAKSGAKMADLPGQMDKVVAQRPAAVTILMGGNDVCTSSEATMTTVADFSAGLNAALAKLATTGTFVHMASIPDVQQLWSLFKSSSTARSVWKSFNICQSMLANPTSTLQADVDRRARVRQREIAFNTVLANACTALGASRCRWDGGAIFATAFAKADVSTRDYFHPSLAGQAKLAATLWPVWFP